jgi:hypothetical protein
LLISLAKASFALISQIERDALEALVLVRQLLELMATKAYARLLDLIPKELQPTTAKIKS